MNKRSSVYLSLAAVICIVVGCKTVNRAKSTAKLVPPLPPGLVASLSVKQKDIPSKLAFEVGTNFAFTKIASAGNNVILEWQNGNAPFTIESSGSLNGPWIVAGISTNRNITLAKVLGQTLYRVSYLQTPSTTPNSLVWAKEIYSTGQTSINYCSTDSIGNIVVCGYGQGVITFAPGQSINTGRNSVTWFVAWYDSSGVFQHATVAKNGSNTVSEAECMAISLAIGADNEPIVVGALRGVSGQIDNVNFGDGVPVEAFGNNDIVVVKYKSDGTIRWLKQYGTPGANMLAQGPRHATIVLDTLGNPVIAAGFEFTVNFGNGYILSAPFHNGLVLKLNNSNGTTQWASAVAVNNLYLFGITSDSLNNVYVCGEYGYYSSFTSTGTHRWTKQISPTTGCRGFGITYDTLTSKVIISGAAQLDTDFGGGMRHTLYNGGFFISAYEPSTGNYGGWDLLLGGSGDVAYDVNNLNGKLYVTGVSLNGINYGTGYKYGSGYFLFTTDLQVGGSPANHSLQRSQVGISAGHRTNCKALNFYTGGFYQSGITLGINNEVGLPGHSARDGFVAKYNR